MNPGHEQLSAGVLGLGIIGSRVARRLLDANIPLALWNRTPRDFSPLPPIEDSPAALAQKSRILQIFVSDDAALRETIRALLPALSQDHILLSHATVSPQTVIDLARDVSSTGAKFLDAPFTGSRDAAAAGQITYYIGGDPQTLDLARPILEISAATITPIGKVGDASAIKVATNIIAAAAAVSVAEAVNLLRANHVDPAMLPTALATNASNSGVATVKLAAILANDFVPRFSARNMRKDLRIANSIAAADQGTLTAAMLDLLERTCAQGHADEDFAAVVKVK